VIIPLYVQVEHLIICRITQVCKGKSNTVYLY